MPGRDYARIGRIDANIVPAWAAVVREVALAAQLVGPAAHGAGQDVVVSCVGVGGVVVVVVVVVLVVIVAVVDVVLIILNRLDRGGAAGGSKLRQGRGVNRVTQDEEDSVVGGQCDSDMTGACGSRLNLAALTNKVGNDPQAGTGTGWRSKRINSLGHGGRERFWAYLLAAVVVVFALVICRTVME